MVAISLRCIGESVHLHFYLERESELDGEEIREIEAELSALQFTDIPILSHTVIVGTHENMNTFEGRKIYVRHLPSTDGYPLGSNDDY